MRNFVVITYCLPIKFTYLINLCCVIQGQGQIRRGHVIRSTN